MAVVTNFKIFWKLIRHLKTWIFLQIIWHMSCAFVNIITLFSAIENRTW